MSLADDDPLEDVERGDTATVSKEVEISVWDVAPTEALGDGRKVVDLDASNIRIEGDSGNESVVYEVEYELRKVDDRTYPVFQTEERFERLQQYKGETSSQQNSLPDWLSPVARLLHFMISVGICAAVAATVANEVNKQLVTINGQEFGAPLGGPGMWQFVGVVLACSAIVWVAINILTGNLRSSSRGGAL